MKINPKSGAWPETAEELATYIQQTLNGTAEDLPKDLDAYSLAGQKMVNITAAAYNHAAIELGATGFMAGWAANRFFGMAKSLEGPWQILTADNMIYPQYSKPSELAKEFENNPGVIQWAANKAKERLEEIEANGHGAAPEVLAYLKEWAAKVETNQEKASDEKEQIDKFRKM